MQCDHCEHAATDSPPIPECSATAENTWQAESSGADETRRIRRPALIRVTTMKHTIAASEPEASPHRFTAGSRRTTSQMYISNHGTPRRQLITLPEDRNEADP